MLPERYMPRKFSSISKSDKRVSIVGKIVEVKADSNSFVLSDATFNESSGGKNKNKVEILLESENSFNREKVEKEKGKLVRTFCTLLGEHLKLDVLQPLDGLDLNLSKAVDELYEKAGI